MLKQVFENHFSNTVYQNNIRIKALKGTNIQIDASIQAQHSFNDLVGCSFLESVIRLFLKLTQNDACVVHLIFFKELIIEIFKHLRLNDGELYNYLIEELLSLLVDLNQIHNSYLKSRDANCFVNDIQQLKCYTEKMQRSNLSDYLMKDVEVPLINLKVIRIYYVQLLEILTEFVDPIKDLSCSLSDKVCNLIELNLVCSTSEMDSALVSFVTNCYFVFDYKRPCFQKCFQFVCSITERYSNCDNVPINQPQLDKLWHLFLDSLNYLHEEDKTIQLMFYLVDNSINLHRCRSKHYLQYTLPKILFRIFDKQFDNQRDKVAYQRLVIRILDFYSTNLSETYLQSDEWCKLIKCLLIEDYITSLKVNDLIHYSYLFKFWEFIDRHADIYLFQSANLLIKFINYSNILLPCCHYISLKEENDPDFFQFELIQSLVNILLKEFKNPNPSIEHLNDELIEHIYLVASNFVKLANQHQQELSNDQIAVFYLPWHERKLVFVKEQQNVLNNLSRRSFSKTDKILKICLNSIAELPSIGQHNHQIDFFDFILNNEFDQLKELVKPVFKFYMFIANRFLQEKFNQWLDFLINNEDKKFISSNLGIVSCLLFKNCEAIYEVVDQSSIQIEITINCIPCDNLFDPHDFEGLNSEHVKLVRKEFNRYLSLDDLDNLNTLINKSSSQFFNHIDIDEQLIQNVLNLFDLVEPEAKKNFHKLLDNMFKSLKIEKERFFSSFKDRFFNRTITNSNQLDTIAKFENIGLMCDYFPKYKLQIIIYMLDNGILRNQDFVFHTTIILRGVVFKHQENGLVNYFLSHKTKICEEFLRRILEQDVKPKIAFERLQKLMFLIGESEENFKQLFIESFDIVLPCLIKNRNDRSQALLDYMLYHKVLDFTNVSDLILNFFEQLVLYFVRNMNVEEIKNALEYIRSLVDVDVYEFFSMKGMIVYSLLCEYCSQEKSINYILSILNSEGYEDDEKKIKRKYVDFNMNSQALSSYLADKMGGYLLNLNAQFIRSQDIAFKTILLKSLNLIIKIVSTKTVSNYFEKLMAILRSAFKYQSSENEDYQNYVSYMYTVWDTLISKCEIRDLANNLSLICKNLMDLLPIDQAGVSQVFQKLIVPNENALKASFKELHFIPKNYRLMNTTNQVIQKYMFKMPENDQDIISFENVLKILEESLKVENPDIKFFHYRKLLQVLTENEKCLRSFCSSGNDLTVQPIISRLIYKLITDSKMDNSQLRSVIGECLGEFGALDSG